MNRTLGIAGLVAVLSLALGSPAAASPQWCEDDPVVHFSTGTSVHLVTRFDAWQRTSATVVSYQVTVPSGVTASVTYHTPRNQRVPSDVVVTADANQPTGSAAVTVTVNGGSFPIEVTVSGGRQGSTSISGSSGGTSFPLAIAK